MPIPLVPGDKSIKYDNWTILAGNGEYEALWNNAKNKNNIGNYAGKYCIIADFDAKGEHQSIKVYEQLKTEHPEILENCIIEVTPSGGIHLTYKWTSDAITTLTSSSKGKTFARFNVNDEILDVELLTRGSQAVMPPSITNKGEYKYISEITHTNTKKENLNSLPEVFMKAQYRYTIEESNKPVYIKPVNRKSCQLQSNELNLILDELIDAYLKNAVEGHRHYQALGLAANIAGIPGVTQSDVQRAVESFFTRSRQPNSSSEIDGIVRFGMSNASHDPAIPWKKITQARIQNDYKAILNRRGVKV